MTRDYDHDQPNYFTKIRVGAYLAVFAVVALMVISIIGGFGKNDTSNWQVIQSVWGKVSVNDSAGWYLRNFAAVWTYPRAVMKEFKSHGGELTQERSDDESIKVTFNDGGIANMGMTLRYATPKTESFRRLLHNEFGGNIENVTAAVKSHLVNCAKATAPLMSSSEHMSARKAEFTQLVHDQLSKGLYRMQRFEKALKETGQEITIFATEIVLDADGTPLIAQPSPLHQYELEVLQFSIEATEYDSKTLEKFAAKKDSLLKAEQAKAEREQEVQQRLMIVERGLREKAEVEATANVEKAAAVIRGQKEKEVAELDASKKVAIAKQTKLEAETKSSQQVAVATLELEEQKLHTQSANERAKQVSILAKAEEERIQKAGAVTESQQVLAQIAAKRDVEVAAHLSKIHVPHVVIAGGGDKTGSSVLENLIQMTLLRSSGVLPDEAMAKMRMPVVQEKE
jgi:hypothetical protein